VAQAEEPMTINGNGRLTERWNGRKIRNLTPVESVYLNPGKDKINATENKSQLKNAA
jgi:hypothetical protein